MQDAVIRFAIGTHESAPFKMEFGITGDALFLIVFLIFMVVAIRKEA